MEDVVYVGKDLEAMSFAINYHKWILRDFRSSLGRSIVEVGAGTGDFSELLLGEKPDSLSLVEPSEMFTHLRQNINSDSVSIHYYKSIFANVCDEISQTHRPDTILYINVLEHIEDDVEELRLMYECLQPGGRALIFVPALPWLYGGFDKAVGHQRRYVKNEIIEKATSAKFKIKKVKYFDFAGIIPWVIKYKVFPSDELESSVVKLYDTWVVPTNRRIETLITPPIGKNLLCIFEKP